MKGITIITVLGLTNLVYNICRYSILKRKEVHLG